jgi:hypothetical protein
VTVVVPPDVRALLVRQLGAALAAEYRRLHQAGDRDHPQPQPQESQA